MYFESEVDVFLFDDLGPWPTNGWDTALPADMEMEQTLLEQARDYALTGGGAGMITRHGQAVLSWGDTTAIDDVKSATKSIGALVLGLAVKDNVVALSDVAQMHYPGVGANPASNVDTGWLDEITLRELMWAFAVLNILFWGLLVLRLFVRPEWSYYVFIVLLIFWLVGGASLGVKWRQVKTDQRAVVLAGEVAVLAGPDSDDTVLFKLHEGTTIHRERIEDGWSLIRLSENKRGWLKSSAIELIVR